MLVNNPELLPKIDIFPKLAKVGRFLLKIVSPAPYVLPEHMGFRSDGTPEYTGDPTEEMSLADIQRHLSVGDTMKMLGGYYEGEVARLEELHGELPPKEEL